MSHAVLVKKRWDFSSCTWSLFSIVVLKTFQQRVKSQPCPASKYSVFQSYGKKPLLTYLVETLRLKH